jgi:hypothetical protein
MELKQLSDKEIGSDETIIGSDETMVDDNDDFVEDKNTVPQAPIYVSFDKHNHTAETGNAVGETPLPKKTRKKRESVKTVKPRATRKPRQPRQPRKPRGLKNTMNIPDGIPDAIPPLPPTPSPDGLLTPSVDANLEKFKNLSGQSRNEEFFKRLSGHAKIQRIVRANPVDPSQMALKIAEGAKLAVASAADFFCKANGAIKEEFEKDQFLTNLISQDLMQYPSLLSSKFQIAVCSGVNVAKGIHKKQKLASTQVCDSPVTQVCSTHV